MNVHNNVINSVHLGQHVVQVQWLRSIVSVNQSTSGYPGGPVITALGIGRYEMPYIFLGIRDHV